MLFNSKPFPTKFRNIDTNPIKTQTLTSLPLKYEIQQIPAFGRQASKEFYYNDGLPQLNAKQWARMMNIASIEYGITRLQKVKEMNQNSPEPYKYDLMILKEQDILNRLTGNAAPDELIRGMIEESLRW